MKRNGKLRFLTSLLCLAALLAGLACLPHAAAGDLLLLNFDYYGEGEEWNGDGETFANSLIPAGNNLDRIVTTENGKKFMLMSIKNTDESTGTSRNRFRTVDTYDGTFTVEWDVTVSYGVRMETYLRTGGCIRVRIMNNRLSLGVEEDAKTDSMKSLATSVSVEAGRWYTLKAVVSPEKIELSAYDKQENNQLLDTISIIQDASKKENLLDPYNVWFDLWGNADMKNTDPVYAGLDNIYITPGTYDGIQSDKTAKPVDFIAQTAPKQQESVELLHEDFQSAQEDENFVSEAFKNSDLPSGGAVGHVVRKASGNKYLQMLTQHAADSTDRARCRYYTNATYTGAFTVEWDYNNVTPKRGRNFEVYVRRGGDERVRVKEDGEVAVYVANEAKVDGVMETTMGGFKLDTATWYTFKVTVSDDALKVEVFNKDKGGASAGTITMKQTASAKDSFLDPAPIWLDQWGAEETGDLEPRAVAIDNLSISQGTYEGVRNLSVQTPAAASVTAVQTAEREKTASSAMLDVGRSAWYRPAVDYALEHKLMSGYNAYTFGPYDTLSRAMVVQVLYNKEGQPATDAPDIFTDVPAGQWFRNAVRWGAAKNVVAGFGGGLFKPDDPVTVEQVAVILHNYSGKPAGNGDVSAFGTHSGWADAALAWAAEKGLMDGMPFDAVTDPANRAQTAQMLMNYLR